MEILKLLVHLPIVVLILGWISYVGYLLHSNKKMRKDLELRKIIDEVNLAQSKNDNLDLVSLVRLAHERKLQRASTRPDSQKK